MQIAITFLAAHLSNKAVNNFPEPSKISSIGYINDDDFKKYSRGRVEMGLKPANRVHMKIYYQLL